MLVSRASTQVSRRLLHTSSVQYGFMGWFSMKKDQEKKKKVEAEDTSKVIEKAEKGEIALTRVEKIEFIGKKVNKDTRSVAERLQGFQIKHWLNRNKVQTADEFKQLLNDTYTKLTKQTQANLADISLENLNFRFQFTKTVQTESGYMIPDYVLTRASDASVLQKYFETQILTGKYKELNPHHLSISELKVSSPNISIQEPVTIKQKKTTFKKLLREAKAAREAKAEKLIEGVRA